MAKKKKEEPREVKPFIISAAIIKDDFCEYEFEIRTGVGVGDVHKVKGKGIIDPDMTEAFQKLNVHLACIDDVFKHTNTEITDINKEHNHDLAFLYQVTGFKMKGNGDNETITLIGTKFISQAGDRVSITTPRIPLDKLSSYRWHQELKETSDIVRNEVELYKDGKCMPVEEEEIINPNQMTIADVNLEDGKVD